MTATLAIVGCGPRLEVALASPAMTSPGLVAMAGRTPRSELVMAAVDLLVRAAGIDRTEITGVVTSRGPGSFTGIRVALATAQGLAMALGARAHAFPSLLAQAVRTTAPSCLAAQPARRGHAYVQPFERRDGAPTATAEPTMTTLAELATVTTPVVAPAGFKLDPGTPLAETTMSTAEALLLLLEREAAPEITTLAPIYLENAPAQPVHPKVTAWPPSQTAS
jgi:tRNA threonylcarbamoyladenosine biosynthesis protein TsaB